MYGFDRPEFEIRDGKLIRCITLAKEVEIPEGITEIGDYAFRLCPNVRFLRIPDSVTKLGEAPFQGCRSLTGIHIPAHLLDGMELISAIKLFAENPVNYPFQEQRLIELFLNETGDFNEAFRNLLVGRLTHPFHARRWLRISMNGDEPKWVEKILSFHETLPRLVIDECIELATQLNNSQILSLLMDYTRNHTITDEELILEEW